MASSLSVKGGSEEPPGGRPRWLRSRRLYPHAESSDIFGLPETPACVLCCRFETKGSGVYGGSYGHFSFLFLSSHGPLYDLNACGQQHSLASEAHTRTYVCTIHEQLSELLWGEMFISIDGMSGARWWSSHFVSLFLRETTAVWGATITVCSSSQGKRYCHMRACRTPCAHIHCVFFSWIDVAGGHRLWDAV